MSEPSAQLLSRSCTTGWMDWVWGELWLLPDGLARLSQGWRGTVVVEQARQASGRGPTVPTAPLETWSIAAEELRRLVKENPRNRWVSRSQIRRVDLREGRWDMLPSSRLKVELVDGGCVKLFWHPFDPAFGVLQTVLRVWLDDSLRQR